MLEVRASVIGSQSLALIERVARPAPVLVSAVAAPASIVRAVHVLERGPLESRALSAARSYLSSGLASPDADLQRLGWLIDVRA